MPRVHRDHLATHIAETIRVVCRQRIALHDLFEQHAGSACINRAARTRESRASGARADQAKQAMLRDALGCRQ
jgi:hypothetical protein